MKSLFLKNYIFYSGLILLSVCLIGGVFIMQVNNYAVSEKQGVLKRTAERAADSTAVIMENNIPQLEGIIYQMNLQQMAGDADAGIIICDNNGNVLYFVDSHGFYKVSSGTLSQQAINTVKSSGYFSEMGNLSGFYNNVRYTVGVPIVKYVGISGAVFVSAPADTTVKLLKDILGMFLMIVAIVLFVTLIISYFLTAQLTRPLKKMAMAAKSFARGDFSVRVPDKGRKDEIGELAANFNNMALSLENFEELRSSFIANVSHDLKTPMTTISGFIDGILDGTIPQDKQAQYLKIISDEVKRLSRLATTMLESAKIESGQMKLNKTPFDICEMASRIILSFEQIINQRHINVNLDIPETLVITADKDSIFQVVYNLIDNAVKYTEDYGNILMKIESAGHIVTFKIANTGHPIPAKDLPFIFDRFYKVDRSRGVNRQGSGLGLYIAKNIINLHFGDITCESADGVTTFEFTLPIN